MVTATTFGVIDHFEQQLAEQREQNARGYAREAALVELRSLAVDVATAQNAHDISPGDLWASARTPEQHARLRSLVDRALAPEEDTE